MVNPWAGEVSLILDGQARVMKLTLGALAELEAQLEEGSVLALVERFESGAFSTQDLLGLLVAGFRGGGWACERADLLSAEIEGGFAAAIAAAGQLLVRAFATPKTQ